MSRLDCNFIETRMYDVRLALETVHVVVLDVHSFGTAFQGSVSIFEVKTTKL